MGKADIGQACIVNNGQALAIEAAEGTDAMMQRLSLLPIEKRGTLPSGILVKLPKPNQERRGDLPTIGANTVENAIQAGLVGIVIAANNTYVLEIEKVIDLANKNHLFIQAI
jgi:DUF1009 family protein